MLLVEHPESAGAAQAAQQRIASEGGACAFVAGGTALQLGWGDQAPAIRLIDVSALPGAQGVSLVDGQLRIGAAMRLEAVRRNPDAARCAPLLVQACSALAALSVRHLGTVGGNVGWGFGDCLPALLAMDADAELADGSLAPLCELLAQNGPLPLLVALRIDAHRFSQEAAGLRFQEKVGHRASFSPARINLALTATPTPSQSLCNVRIAVSAAGVKARRLRALEQQIESVSLTHVASTSLRAACEADLSDSDELALLAANLVAGWLNSARP